MESLTTVDEVRYVARQPILDSRSRVYDYERLYRSARSDIAFSGRASQASARILSESMAGLDLDVPCDGHLAFLNMPVEVLLLDAGGGLSPDKVVFEILEDVPVTSEVIEMCRSLRKPFPAAGSRDAPLIPDP